jgi:hypothetical protein
MELVQNLVEWLEGTEDQRGDRGPSRGQWAIARSQMAVEVTKGF